MNTTHAAAATAVEDPSHPTHPADGWLAAIDALDIHHEQNRWSIALGNAIAATVRTSPDDAIALAEVLVHVHGMQTGSIEAEQARADEALQRIGGAA